MKYLMHYNHIFKRYPADTRFSLPLRGIITKSLILFLIYLSFASFCQADEIIDRIVAQVNDDVIALSELNEKGKPFFQAIMTHSKKNNIEKELQTARLEVLDKLIETLLIKQEAAKYGITISASNIEQAINSLLTNNKLTPEQFKKELKRLGTSEEDYRENIRNQMLKSRVVNIAIRSKILVTDQQVKEYYNTYYTVKDDVPEGYHIQQIGLQWGNDKKLKTREAAESVARKIIRNISAGEDFASLCHTYSQLPSAEDGGDIGAFKENEMAPYMLQAVKALHPGETSGIVETPSGIQILKLLSHRKDGVIEQAPLETVKSDIEDILYNQKMKKSYDKWLRDLHAKAYINKIL